MVHITLVRMVSDNLLPVVFYGTVAPLLVWLTVKKLVLEPLEQRRKTAARQAARESAREAVAAARREAEAAVSLMEERWRRVVTEEEARGGTYG